MFSDEILSEILLDKEMRKIPIGAQSTAISVIERIIDKYRKEGKYESIFKS